MDGHRTDLYTVLDDNIIVASNYNLCTLAAWNGEGVITFYELLSNNSLMEIDRYTNDDPMDIVEARDLSYTYFENMKRELFYDHQNLPTPIGASKKFTKVA